MNNLIMKLLFHQRAFLLNRLSSVERRASAATATTTMRSSAFRAASTNVQPRVVTSTNNNNKRSMHTSLYEAAYFTVTDDGYDASKYGYRVVVPTSSGTPAVLRRRHSSTMTNKIGSNSNNNNNNSVDDYAEYMMQSAMGADPRNLDILSSPEVLAILESQREWDSSLRNDDYETTDCEVMQDSWESFTIGVESSSDGDSFHMTPSLDEKEM